LSSQTFELIYLTGPDAGKRIPLVDNYITMGRSKKNGLAIDDPSISRHHLTFQVDDQKVLLEDAGSSHGTQIDGKRIDSVVRLEDKCVIQAGDQKFEFAITSSEMDADATVIFHNPAEMLEQFEEARIKEAPGTESNGPDKADAAKQVPAQPPTNPPPSSQNVIDTVIHDPSPLPAAPPVPEDPPGDATRIINQAEPSPDATRIMNPQDQTRMLTNDQTRVLTPPPPGQALPPPPLAPAAPPAKSSFLPFVVGLITGALLIVGATALLPKTEPTYDYQTVFMGNQFDYKEWDKKLAEAQAAGYTLDHTVSQENQTIIIFRKQK
jgi:predicted component of type VI protein secretion system